MSGLGDPGWVRGRLEAHGHVNPCEAVQLVALAIALWDRGRRVMVVHPSLIGQDVAEAICKALALRVSGSKNYLGRFVAFERSDGDPRGRQDLVLIGEGSWKVWRPFNGGWIELVAVDLASMAESTARAFALLAELEAAG